MKQNLDVSLALKDTIRFLSNSNRQWLITLLRGHLLTWRIFTIIVETTTLFYSYLCTHWVLLSHRISYSRISYTIVPLLHFACYWFIICSHCLNRGYYHIAYGICPVISYVCVCVYLVTYSTTQGRSNYPTPPISSHLHVASEAKYLPSSEHSERLTDSSIVVIDAIVLSEAASSDEVDEFQCMTQSAPVAWSLLIQMCRDKHKLHIRPLCSCFANCSFSNSLSINQFDWWPHVRVQRRLKWASDTW